MTILLKSVKVSSCKIFQNRPSAKISSREILTQNGTTTNMMEMYLICFKKIHNKLIHVFQILKFSSLLIMSGYSKKKQESVGFKIAFSACLFYNKQNFYCWTISFGKWEWGTESTEHSEAKIATKEIDPFYRLEVVFFYRYKQMKMWSHFLSTRPVLQMLLMLMYNIFKMYDLFLI